MFAAMTTGSTTPGQSPSRPYVSANQQVYAAMREAIIRCDLLPGEKLSESDVSAQFGVSRQPVREAFIKLSQDGLIQVLPQRGTFVSRISTKRVSDGRFIREAVEVAIVERAVKVIGSAQLDLLADNLQAQAQEAQQENRQHFFELDDDFHYALAKAVDCVMAWKMLQDIKANMDRVRYLSLFKESPLRDLQQQHQAIFEALKTRDLNAARTAVKSHLNELNFSFASISSRNSEWFDG